MDFVDYLNVVAVILLVVSTGMSVWALRSGQLEDSSSGRPAFSPIMAASGTVSLIAAVLIIINIFV